MEISNDPTIERNKCLNALSTVYNPSDPNSPRETADRYLTAMQRHPVAWQVSDQLLSSSSTTTNTHNYGMHVYFFAAQTIHVKCRADIAQLKEGQLPSLRDSLMSHLLNFIHVNHSQAIVTRLAMALCSLAVQMHWTTIVDDLLGNVQPPPTSQQQQQQQQQQQDHDKVHLVLEIITLLPEEATTDRLLLKEEHSRHEFISMLFQSSSQILSFLHYCVSKHDANAKTRKEKVLRCLLSWVRYITPPPHIVQESPLLDWIFQILHMYQPNDITSDTGGDIFDLSVDAIVEIIRCYPSSSRESVGLVHKIIPLVMALGDTHSKTPFQRSMEEEDEDGMRAYCRIFTEMGESYMSLILHYEDLNQTSLVDLILACSALPDHDIASITLNFWYQFITGLEDIEPYEYRQMQIDNFAPQIHKLVLICTSLLRYPDDIDSLLEDMVDDIHRDRFYVTDTLEDCCRLLGGHVVLQSIGAKLQQEVQRVQQQSLSAWHEMEACLKALSSASRYIPYDEKNIIPYTMRLIPTLPATVIHLRITSNLFIGAYSMWLNANPEYLQPILPFLAQGLSEPKCASSSALAIKQLCQSCSSQLALGDSVLELYSGILHAQQQQQSNVIDLKDELEVFEGACHAISRQMGELVKTSRSDDVSSYINRVVEPIGIQLMAVASNNSIGPKQAVAVVERLTIVIRFLQVPNTVSNHNLSRSQFLIDLMTQCWSALDHLSTKFTDFTMAEKLCRLHKHCLRECGSVPYKPLFEKLCDHLTRAFTVSRQSPYLYASSVCVAEFSKDPTCIQKLYEMIEDMAKTSFSLLASPDDFKSKPDVVEELFFLGSRMVQHCPHIFVSSPLFHPFLQGATIGMQQDHRDANRGALNFLETALIFGLILQGRGGTTQEHQDDMSRKNLEHAFGKEGDKIASNVILSLIGDLPCYRISTKNGSISGILLRLYKLCPGLLLEWMKAPLSKIHHSQQTLLLNALSDHRSEDDFYASVNKFADICIRSRKMGGSI
jgi:transportin-3